MTQKTRQDSFLSLLALLGFVFLSFNPVHAEIVIDGELNEAEWKQAQAIEDFVVTRPFSLEAPTYKTKVLVYSDLEGIYVGFVNQQPMETRDRRRHNRDMLRQDYDRNVVVVEHQNQKKTGTRNSSFLGLWYQ